MENSEIIVAGPEFSGTEFWGSVAQYLVPKLKGFRKDLISQVECATNESITYQEFLRQSLEFAEGLIEFGLKEGDVVVFLGRNDIRGHVAALGTIFSGGILCPLDEHLKPFELKHLLNQAQPKYVLCLTEKGKEFREILMSINLDPKIVLMDSPGPVGEFAGWENVRAEVDLDSYVPRGVKHPEESLAVVLFSSGTTGRPKGVKLSHFAVLHNLAVTESLQLSAKTENFIFSSPLHWISGFILLINSCNFGQTRYIPRSDDPEDLLEAIKSCKPYFVLVAPNIILSMVRLPNFTQYDVKSVKVIFSVGATLGERVLAEIKSTWNDIMVCNMYGLTETFGGINLPYESESRNAVGKLLPGVSVKVVDPSTGKSLGPYKTGELRVKGKRVMKGYYNNEELTKAAFDEKGWLRTGDLLYYDEECVFYFAGRIKEVIQYLNHQVSPVELESFLICVPGVKDVAIVPIPHEMDDNHVRALVVKEPKSDISAEDVIRAVKENFAQHQHLTGGVQFVDSLPRNAVGKLRRLEAEKMVDFTGT